jgi:hypothetical protein
VIIVDNTKPQPVVITNTTTVIREVEEQKMNYMTVAIIVSVLIGVIVVGGIVGFCFFSRKGAHLKNQVSMDNNENNSSSK